MNVNTAKNNVNTTFNKKQLKVQQNFSKRNPLVERASSKVENEKNNYDKQEVEKVGKHEHFMPEVMSGVGDIGGWDAPFSRRPNMPEPKRSDRNFP